MKGMVSQIAEKHEVSPTYVRGLIKEHPELGIVLEPNKTTNLSPNQQSSLSALILREKEKSSSPLIANNENGESISIEIDSLKERLAEAERRAAAAEALAAERLRQMDDLKEMNSVVQKLLTDGKEAAEKRESELRANAEEREKDLREELEQARSEASDAKFAWLEKSLFDRIFKR